MLESLNEQDMNLESIFSICPSLTKIIGTLFDAVEGQRVSYPLLPTSVANGGELSFQRVDDDIIAINQLDVPVLLSFPSTDYCPGKIITIPSHRNSTVTTEFFEHAVCALREFEISVIDHTSATQTYDADHNLVVLQASGKVNRNIMGTVSLCDEINVEILNSDLYIRVIPPYLLQAVSMLHIVMKTGEPERRFLNLEQAAFPSPYGGRDKNALYLPSIIPGNCPEIDVKLSVHCSKMNDSVSVTSIKKEWI